MNRFRALPTCVALLALVSVLAGCSRDPVARMHRYYDKGNRYFAQQKYQEALIEYGNALQIDSGYVDARYQLAQCHLKLGAIPVAFAEFLRVLDLRPGHLPAHLAVGNLLYVGEVFDEAKKHAKFVLDNDPKNPEAHALMANVLGALGDIPGSLREIQTAIDLVPTRSAFYLNRALLQVNAKQLPLAEESFHKAIALDPDSNVARLALADFYQNQKRYPDAEEQFHKAIAKEPKNPRLRLALARIYVLEGLPQKGELTLRVFEQESHEDPASQHVVAEFLLATNQPQKAMFELASLLQAHGKDLWVKKKYIELLASHRRLDEAEKLNKEILEDNARDLDALIYQGEILNRKGQFRDAISSFAKVLGAVPEEPRAHYHQGVSYAGLGDFGNAESEWREAARLRPDMLEVQQALATVAIRKGQMDLLRQSAEKIIALQPGSPTGYILRAATYAADKDDAATEADLRTALELGSADPLPYARLAAWRHSQRRFAEAEKLYEQSLDRDPGFGEALQGLVNLYLEQKQLQKAIDRVNAQLIKVPKNSFYCLMLARLQLAANQPDRAEESLRKAAELDQANLEALLLLAQIQGSRRDSDAAIASYETAIRHNPSDVRAYAMLGSLYQHRGDSARAGELYRKALQVDPDNPLAANNLAYLMLEKGENIDVAISLAQLAHGRMPDSPSAADTLAWAYCKKGANSLAIDLLEDAVKKFPNNPTYHYHLGLAYQGAHDRERARAHLQKVLQLNPQYVHADEIKKALKSLDRG